VEHALHLPTPFTLLVDGPAGAGKTTLAQGVRQEFADTGVDALLLHMDDMYEGWDGLESGVEYVVHNVLEPLRSTGRATVLPWNWDLGARGAPISLTPADVMILEGVGAAATQARPYADMVVWVDTPPDTAHARARARHGGRDNGHLGGWRKRQEAHFALHATRQAADVMVVDPRIHT